MIGTQLRDKPEPKMSINTKEWNTQANSLHLTCL